MHGIHLPPAPATAGPDGIFAALALHLWHQAKGKAVEFVPNRVYAPATVEALGLQVGTVVAGSP